MSPAHRLGLGALLSALLLPVALQLHTELSFVELGLLWLVGTLAGAWAPGFRLLLGGAGLVAVFLALWLFSPLPKSLVDYLRVDQAPRAADAIVILGAGMQCATRELEAASMARMLSGLELWRAGYAPRITLTDTVGEIFGDSRCPSLGLTASAQVRALYGGAGPEVVLLPQMYTTRTEAEATARLVRERGWKTLLVVTSPTHTRRTVATFRNAAAGLPVEMVSVASSEPRFDSTLWKPRDRLLALPVVTRELLGLLTYRLRGWL